MDRFRLQYTILGAIHFQMLFITSTTYTFEIAENVHSETKRNLFLHFEMHIAHEILRLQKIKKFKSAFMVIQYIK